MDINQAQVSAGLASAKMLAGMVGLGPQVQAATAVFTAGKEFLGFSLAQWNAFAPNVTDEQMLAIVTQYQKNLADARSMDLREQ